MWYLKIFQFSLHRMCHLVEPHALPHEVFAFIYIYIYIDDIDVGIDVFFDLGDLVLDCLFEV